MSSLGWWVQGHMPSRSHRAINFKLGHLTEHKYNSNKPKKLGGNRPLSQGHLSGQLLHHCLSTLSCANPARKALLAGPSKQ